MNKKFYMNNETTAPNTENMQGQFNANNNLNGQSKKKWLPLALVGVVVVLLLGGIFLTGNQKDNDEVVKIGVIAPLTGPLAEYGIAFKNGLTMAQEKSENKNIEWIFEDSAYDSGKTVSAFYKLRDSDKIDFLINWGDPTSFALAPLMKDETIPFIAVADIPDVAKTSRYTVRTLNDPKFFTSALWGYFRAHNMKNIAVVKVENPYLNGMYDSLLSTKNDDETVTLVDNYQSFGDSDFRTSITKIRQASSKYDALGVFLASGQIGQFYKQKSSFGLNIQTFGTDFFENQGDIDAAGSAIDGAVYANMNVSDAFKNQYQNKFGNVGQISYAGNGYDTGTILNSLDLSSKDTFTSGMKRITNYSGVSGTIKYVAEDNDRYLYFPVFMKEIRGGSIQVIK